MPRVSEAVIRTELDRLVELLRQATGGLNLARLSETYRGARGTELPRRKLQRRLERLVVAGIVRPDGEDRRTLYHLGSAAR
jgi:DNA-binding IclR family transcriptional regulator